MELPLLPSLSGLKKKLEQQAFYHFPGEIVETIGEFARGAGETLVETFAPAVPKTIEKMKAGKSLLGAYKEVWDEARQEDKQLTEQVHQEFENARAGGASQWELSKIQAKSPVFKFIANASMAFMGGMKIVEQEPIEQTISKLTSVIRNAKPIREVTEELSTIERAKRAIKGAEALEEVSGEKGYFTALGKLKGEFPKIRFEPVREQFTQTEIDDLFNYIKQSSLDFYNKITTSTGLSKLLGKTGGGVPTEGELKLLRDVFGEDLVKEVLKKKPLITKISENIVEAMNVPRALMTSMDMSAWLRQGGILTVHKPKQAFAAAKDMFKFFGSEKFYQAAMDDIANKPTYKLMKDSGLSLTEITGETISLTKKEEAYMSNLAAKLPIVGRLVKASERAYVGFLNKLRVDVFDDVSQEFMNGGLAPAKNSQVFKNLADFINAATGRGELGTYSRVGPALNGIFFSPRFMASRVQMLNPSWYFKLHPAVRKEAVKSMVKFVSTGVGIVGLAKLAGAEVETDPTTADFGKIKIGNVRWDIWGGFQQWTRFTAQMITGRVKSSTTGETRELKADVYPHQTRLDWAMRFIQSKFAPVPALIADILRGQNVIGEPLNWSQEAYDKLVPIYIQDIAEAIDEMGWTAIPAVGIPGFFGVGTQTYKYQKKTSPSLPGLPDLSALKRR